MPDPVFENYVSPWWCKNGHLQTVWRKFFGVSPVLSFVRERWETPDDDFLDLDFINPQPEKAASSSTPLVLCLHGFEGSSHAKYIGGMLQSVQRMGWRGVALNFRSCSGEMNRQPRFYHSGETRDLDWVIRRLRVRWPDAPFFVIGFSLGGSVLLKWLGEGASEAAGLVQAAVAISVPYDLGVAARRIDSGMRRIYGQNFLKTLKQKMIEKAILHPTLIDPVLVNGIKSYIEFENLAFAPLHDFKDAKDYWRRCSAKYFLEGIACPTLVLHSEDDPFLPGSYLPKKIFEASKWLIPEISQNGGHVGFMQGRGPWRVNYWSEARAMTFLSGFLKKG